MWQNKKIYIAGENGLVGSNLTRYLSQKKYNIISTNSKKLDLRNGESVKDFLEKNRPDCIILVAARHGGIEAYQNNPVESFEDNLLISTNVIKSAYACGIKRIINIGASCVYKTGENLILKEEDYDISAVQKSTEPYGLAKLCGMKLCEYYNMEKKTEYISVLPVNLYGNGLNYELDFTSVIPSMMKKIHIAKCENLPNVEIWGDGKAHREFLHVTDFVKAIELLINQDKYKYSLYNIGGERNISINSLAATMKVIVGYDGQILNDLSKPNGADRGVLDCSRIMELGWKPEISLEKGLKEMYTNVFAEK